jgi:hypothetical protein
MDSGKRIAAKAVILIALCVGFVGGYGGFWVARWQAAKSSDHGVIRASGIELVGPGGKVFSTLAQDPSNGSAGMSFYDENGKLRATVGLRAAARLPSGQWSKYAPSVVFLGNDGGSRLELLVDTWDKPVMYMGSADWEGRVVLGHGGISSEGPPPGDSPVWELGFTTPGRTGTTLIGTAEAFGSRHATSFIGLNDQTHSLAIEPDGVRKLR